VQGKPDDFKSMEEVLYRRLNKLAYQSQYEGYKFKKAVKKQNDEIQKLCKKNGVNKSKADYKSFYVIQKDDKLCGTVIVTNLSEKTSTLTALTVTKEERGKKLGHKIIKEAAKKAKGKRVYVFCEKELLEYYQIAGFEQVKTVNKELKEFYPKASVDKKYHCLVLDKIKLKVDPSFSEKPDLVVIDGGKGQLSAAGKIFKQLQLNIPYISLAKRLEEIFIPGEDNSLILDKNNPALQLVQRARDEAHRFAITYNRKLRSKKFK
jgi:N-acetylglutamate synthase-like GNAT family acetyltransferase